MAQHAHSLPSPLPADPPSLALAPEGDVLVAGDREGFAIAGGPRLLPGAAVAAAVIDRTLWLIARDADGHALHRFDTAGLPAGPVTRLGDLGAGVVLSAGRGGPRVALVEGERGALIREAAGGRITLDPLGPRGVDRRVLLSGRGVLERRGGALVPIRPAALGALALPAALGRGTVVGGALVLDGAAAAIEMDTRGLRHLLVYELRRGELRQRIHLGASRVVAIAERGGVVALAGGPHLAILDLRIGACRREHVLPAPVAAAAIDALGVRLVVRDERGTLHELGAGARDARPPAANDDAEASAGADAATEGAGTPAVTAARESRHDAASEELAPAASEQAPPGDRAASDEVAPAVNEQASQGDRAASEEVAPAASEQASQGDRAASEEVAPAASEQALGAGHVHEAAQDARAAMVDDAPAITEIVRDTVVATDRELDAALARPLLGLRPARAAEWSAESSAEFLADARAWIAGLCRTALAVAADRRPASGDPHAALEALLAPRAGHDPERVAQARELERSAARRFARWSRRAAPHAILASELGLSPLGATLLLLAAAPLLWSELPRVYAAISGDPARALVDEQLLAELLEADATTRAAIARELDPDGPLARSGALIANGRARPYAALAVHPVVVRRLAGERFGAIPGVTREADRELAELIAPRAGLVSLVEALAEPGPAARVVLRGRTGSGRRTIAAALAARAGRTLATVEVAAGDDAADGLARALAEMVLRGFLPCVALDELSDDPREHARVRAVLDAHPGPLFVRARHDQVAPLAPGHHVLELPPPTEVLRRAAWAGALERRGLPSEPADALAARFAIAPGVIERACDHPAIALVDDGELVGALAAAVRQHRTARLGAIATRVERLASWDDLVVPDDLLDGLRELVARVRHRRVVLDDWGMARAAATARGVTALFQGSPGTGKTMSAGVIAAALGYELWRVDLSKVMSRWLGETEKNLGAVFDAAEDGEVVLLFDEADSLFGKRTEVKSSHDRYANVEVNYLLQRLDDFGGVAILTTNFGTAIDPAFARRLSLHVQFPFPDETDRERLWRAHLPSRLPVAGSLDLEGLARRYQLSGGLIRNAALRAAYLAAAGGGPLTHDQLERAVRLEYAARGQLGDGRLE